MSKSFISKFVAVASLTALSTLSVMANAEAFSSYREVPGVVTSVDAEESTITITTEDGVSETFNVVKGAKIATEQGRVLSLAKLGKGSTVVLKNRVFSAAADNVVSSNK